MNKVFIDSDIILDVLARREPFYNDSSKLLSLAETKRLQAFTSPIVMANVYYILRKLTSKSFTLESLRKLRVFIKIVPVSEKHIDQALSSGFSDFEDAIQYFSSTDRHLGFIITRNKKDYKPDKISICTPSEFLKIFQV